MNDENVGSIIFVQHIWISMYNALEYIVLFWYCPDIEAECMLWTLFICIAHYLYNVIKSKAFTKVFTKPLYFFKKTKTINNVIIIVNIDSLNAPCFFIWICQYEPCVLYLYTIIQAYSNVLYQTVFTKTLHCSYFNLLPYYTFFRLHSMTVSPSCDYLSTSWSSFLYIFKHIIPRADWFCRSRHVRISESLDEFVNISSILYQRDNNRTQDRIAGQYSFTQFRARVIHVLHISLCHYKPFLLNNNHP